MLVPIPGEDLVAGLERIGQTADLPSFTKWLDNDEMFDEDAPSDASLAFAALSPGARSVS